MLVDKILPDIRERLLCIEPTVRLLKAARLLPPIRFEGRGGLDVRGDVVGRPERNGSRFAYRGTDPL